MPVVFVNLPDIEKERNLIFAFKQNTSDWDYELLQKLWRGSFAWCWFDDVISRIWDEQLSVEDDDFDLDEANSNQGTKE